MMDEIDVLLHPLHRMIAAVEEVIGLAESLLSLRGFEERREISNRIDELTTTLSLVRSELVNEVLYFVARRQPLGRDLVETQVLINLAYDIYRIARYCREIARVDLEMGEEGGLRIVPSISEALRIAKQALIMALSDAKALKAENRDKVLALDRLIDEKFVESIRVVAQARQVEGVAALKLLLMRHIERMVDHATYIEDWLQMLE